MAKRSLPKVYVVDDDAAIRDSLRFMFTGTSLAVETFSSAEEFLSSYHPGWRGCVILDLRMEGMGGAGLQGKLREMSSHLPVIILTGHGDVPAAVKSMKLGAVDFLTKPVNRRTVLSRVEEALAMEAERARQMEQARAVKRRFEALTPRERELLTMLGAGLSSKMIASRMRISVRTVANHRAHLLAKTRALNTAELVRLAMLEAPASDGL